jgi:uncharacterized membrane protein (UPF0127 family)
VGSTRAASHRRERRLGFDSTAWFGECRRIIRREPEQVNGEKKVFHCTQHLQELGRLVCAIVLSLLTSGVARATDVEWALARLPSGAQLQLEVARDEATRRRGYMYRERVGPREGMLFVFEQDGRHGIWMKNCRVPLDIVWLDPDFRVVHVAFEQQPCPASGACPSILPLGAARYVLEVAGGVARAEGLVRGDRLTLIVEPPSP